MRFYEQCFFSENLNDSKENLIDKMNQGKTFYHTYMIVIPLNTKDSQLEIYHTEMRKQFYFHEEDYIVIGLTLGNQEALSFLEEITWNIYKETGDVKIKEYYLNKMEF